MMGDHAIYHDGWIASTKVMRPPWILASAVSQDPAGYPYKLYDLTKDWTQFDNVADKYPDKVRTGKPVLGGGGQVPGAATRCDGGHPARPTTS
jgi:hypothetical protein